MTENQKTKPSLETLFSEAIELPQSEQIAFVESNCGTNAGLKSELLDLIKSHRQQTVGFILDQPIIRADDDQTSDDTADVPEKEGDRIGRYRLLERIGEGGMGVVYMAEQTEDVNRRVALKIIKLGMDTRQVIARFEVERQAMAMFDHTNIARVLDAGATDTGRPFFVMELVRGTDLISYASKNNLSVSQRLELFIQVCQGIQHAHQKGIVHRDLKPSNILVTLYDGVPIPKIIDFGIAKAINQRLTEKTLFTRYAAMVGTPQYMSPEQAELSGMDIDTRADIYSLGVLLYELLTGTTPLDAKQLNQMNPLALVETLQQHEIETPSSRISRTAASIEGQASGIAAADFELARQIKGDLDWIVLKAVARDRSQRYASATELAADIQRYLAGDPVEAVKPSRRYLFVKTWRKHWKSISLAGLVGTLLVLATAVTSVMSIRALEAKRELASTLTELQQRNDELRSKEAIIRETALKQSYRSAVGLAFEKFQQEYWLQQIDSFANFAQQSQPGNVSELSELLDALKQQERSVDEDLEKGSGAIAAEKVNVSNTATFKVIFRQFDVRPALLDLKHKSIVADALSPLQTYLEGSVNRRPKLKTAGSMSFSTTKLALGPFSDNQSEASVQKIEEVRPDFYRLLVTEYRTTFGDQHPRVAEALNLLAAALLETNQHQSEVQSILRESLAITDSAQSNATSKRLLELAEIPSD